VHLALEAVVALELQVCHDAVVKVAELVPQYALRMRRPRFRRKLGKLREVNDFKEDQKQDRQGQAGEEEEEEEYDESSSGNDMNTSKQHQHHQHHRRGRVESPFVQPLTRTDFCSFTDLKRISSTSRTAQEGRRGQGACSSTSNNSTAEVDRACFSVYCAQDGWTRGAWENKSGTSTSTTDDDNDDQDQDQGKLKGFALIKKMALSSQHTHTRQTDIRSRSGELSKPKSNFLTGTTQKAAEGALSNANGAISEMRAMKKRKKEAKAQQLKQQASTFDNPGSTALNSFSLIKTPV
jgi:hypothetical protein